MKKNYMNPTIDVMAVRVDAMIASLSNDNGIDNDMGAAGDDDI